MPMSITLAESTQEVNSLIHDGFPEGSRTGRRTRNATPGANTTCCGMDRNTGACQGGLLSGLL